MWQARVGPRPGRPDQPAFNHHLRRFEANGTRDLSLKPTAAKPGASAEARNDVASVSCACPISITRLWTGSANMRWHSGGSSPRRSLRSSAQSPSGPKLLSLDVFNQVSLDAKHLLEVREAWNEYRKRSDLIRKVSGCRSVRPP